MMMTTHDGEQRTMSRMPKKRIMLSENFEDVIARYEIGSNEMARLADISLGTLYGLKNPDTQPNRIGGMHRTTAWKLVNAFAEHTGIHPDAAWDMLLVEVDMPRRARTPKAQS